jgi:hypothetical protein
MTAAMYRMDLKSLLSINILYLSIQLPVAIAFPYILSHISYYANKKTGTTINAQGDLYGSTKI